MAYWSLAALIKGEVNKKTGFWISFYRDSYRMHSACRWLWLSFSCAFKNLERQLVISMHSLSLTVPLKLNSLMYGMDCHVKCLLLKNLNKEENHITRKLMVGWLKSWSISSLVWPFYSSYGQTMAWGPYPTRSSQKFCSLPSDGTGNNVVPRNRSKSRTFVLVFVAELIQTIKHLSFTYHFNMLL